MADSPISTIRPDSTKTTRPQSCMKGRQGVLATFYHFSSGWIDVMCYLVLLLFWQNTQPKQLKKEGLIWVHSFRLWSIMAGKSYMSARAWVSHCIQVMKWRELNVGAQITIVFIRSMTKVHGLVLATRGLSSVLFKSLCASEKCPAVCCQVIQVQSSWQLVFTAIHTNLPPWNCFIVKTADFTSLKEALP